MQLAPFAPTNSNAIGVPTYMDTLPQVGNLHQPGQPSTDQGIPFIPIGLVGFCLGSQYKPCQPPIAERLRGLNKWHRFAQGVMGFGWYCVRPPRREFYPFQLWQALWLIARGETEAGIALVRYTYPGRGKNALSDEGVIKSIESGLRLAREYQDKKIAEMVAARRVKTHA